MIKITDNIMLKKNEKLYLENNYINNFISRIAIFACKKGGHYTASLKSYKMKKQHNYANLNNEDSKSNIVVKVVAASICQSDRRALLGTKLNSFKEKKIILGHEGGGYIIDPGPWHKQLYVGQKVVFLPHVTCGICEQCASGNTNLCRKLAHLGFHINGCFTNIAVLPRQSVKPLPNEFVDDAMPLIEPLACVIHALFKIIDKLNALNDQHKNNKVDVQPFTIYGSGPIGTLIAITLKLLWPCVKIRITDILETRLQIASDLQIADHVSHVNSEYPQHQFSIVATSCYNAYLSAIKHTTDKGNIILFSGINEDEKKLYPNAEFIELLHRYEQKKFFVKYDGACCNLIGTSGYNQADIKFSIELLLKYYYNNYRIVQNVVVEGLDASYIRYAHDNKIVVIRNAVEKLLTPNNINDKQHGDLIQSILKVLIKI